MPLQGEITMNINDVKKIAIIGSGAMGHGIGQVCAQAGYAVVIRDIKQEFLDNGIAKVRESLSILVSKEKISQPDMDKALSNIKTTLDMKEAIAGAQIVVEAVPEMMDLKKKIFGEISNVASPDAILATNTSTMSISEIGGVVKNQDRFVGLHFFNPVNRMKLVEVIYGNKTSDATANLMVEVSKRIDKIPVKVMKDRPGFIVNRVNAPVQALLSAILDEGKIKPQELDAVLKKLGMKMAPFETADFVGLDVFCHMLEYFAKTLSPQYKPGKFLTSKLQAKELGAKSGKGIYTWQEGKAQIDTSKETKEITPVHLVAVQLNEAVKVWKEGLAQSIQDIDDAVKHGMNAFAGPFTLTARMQPEQVTEALNTLQQRYGLDILKPEPEIVDGSFKTIGR
jgi:3-hydroxyacyl-CoA dehydrogenase